MRKNLKVIAIHSTAQPTPEQVKRLQQFCRVSRQYSPQPKFPKGGVESPGKEYGHVFTDEANEEVINKENTK